MQGPFTLKSQCSSTSRTRAKSGQVLEICIGAIDRPLSEGSASIGYFCESKMPRIISMRVASVRFGRDGVRGIGSANHFVIGAHVHRIVADPEYDSLQPRGGSGNLVNIHKANRGFDKHLYPDLFAAAMFSLN